MKVLCGAAGNRNLFKNTLPHYLIELRKNLTLDLLPFTLFLFTSIYFTAYLYHGLNRK